MEEPVTFDGMGYEGAPDDVIEALMKEDGEADDA